MSSALAQPTALEQSGFSRFELDSTLLRALADAGINIANITTSEIKISAIIDKGDGERALRVVHDAFGLGNPNA